MKDNVLKLAKDGVCSFNIRTLDVRNYEAEKISKDFEKQIAEEIRTAKENGLEPIFKNTEIQG